jgi:BirA family transcriptional regulator, biotin operon repressor / biotin---[acetyl-CoA-carboxylase] ligase
VSPGPDAPRPDGAAPAVLGRPRLHLRVTDSTNERARELAAAGAPHGSLVTAGEQTAGRGRQGRRWAAPAGSSLLASLVLRPAPRLLPLAAAIAVSDAVDAMPGAERRGPARIKWPNDIVLETGAAPPALAKLAGILIEARMGGARESWAVLGIGLNVAVQLEELPAELRETAATLGLAPEASEPLLLALLDALSRRLAEPPELTLAAWSERDALRGRRIGWEPPPGGGAPGPGASGSGIAQGIDGDGRLVVALEGGGRTALGSGEVHLRPGG